MSVNLTKIAIADILRGQDLLSAKNRYGVEEKTNKQRRYTE